MATYRHGNFEVIEHPNGSAPHLLDYDYNMGQYKRAMIEWVLANVTIVGVEA